MGHDHSAHAHGHAAAAAGQRGGLLAVLALIVVFMCAEVAVGILAGSLALISDAGHMLTDAGAIGFSVLALQLSLRPAEGSLTFGLRRAEILSAQANGVTLILLAVWIAYEAVGRLIDPLHVHAGAVLAVALAGALANIAAIALLSGADRGSMNVEGSFQHILTDLYGFIGTAAAALVILLTGFDRADPLVSLLIAALMVRSGTGLVRASGRVFLEAAPEGLEPEEIGRALVASPGVVEVHDLHVWEVSSGFPALSAHVLVGRDSDCHAARREMESLLRERFGLDHTTLQVDHAGEELLQIQPGPGR